MKFRFKVQAFQTEAVEAVADCFEGQPLDSGLRYRIDPGLTKTGQTARLEMDEGFRNADLALPLPAVLKNIQAVQVRQNLPVSDALKSTAVCDVNLDIEMETGTGKTYCYIKTFFELNRRYGWSKFIVVVPSIAIREGVFQSLTDTSEHFLEAVRKAGPVLYLQLEGTAQPGELQLGRRHQRDGDQCAGIQCARQGCAPHLRGVGRLSIAPANRCDCAEPARS